MPTTDSTTAWVKTPLAMIEKLANDQQEGGNKDAFLKQVESDFVQHFFRDEGEVSKDNEIPCISQVPMYTLKSGQLVRFRCMVQDQGGSEVVNWTCNVKDKTNDRVYKTMTAFKEDLNLPENHVIEMNDNYTSCSQYLDQNSFYCIPIAGQSSWVQTKYQAYNKSSANDAMVVEGGNNKRSNVDTDSDMDVVDQQQQQDMNGNTNKKPHHSQDVNNGVDINNNLERSQVNESLGACIVKSYSNEGLFGLTKTLDVYGVIHFPTPDSDEMNVDTEQGVASKLLPRIHCVYVKELSSPSPLLNHLSFDQQKLLQQSFSNSEDVLKTLNQILIEAFGGDELAAKYLLINLVSRIHSSRDVLDLGSFPINLTNVNNKHAQLISKVCDLLVSNSCLLPLTIDYINNNEMGPIQDPVSLRLGECKLQMPVNTHVLIDETKLDDGKLLEPGVVNVSILQQAMATQSLVYRFEYFTKPYPIDMKFCILSEGRSMFRCNNVVPVETVYEPHTNTLDALMKNGIMNENQNMKVDMDSNLNKIRILLSLMERNVIEIPNEILEIVPNDYAEMRRVEAMEKSKSMDEALKSQPLIGADDLSRILTMARYVTLTSAQKEMATTHWNSAKYLEQTRIERIHKRYGVKQSNARTPSKQSDKTTNPQTLVNAAS